MANMIEVDKLSKQYGEIFALKEVCFQVERGEIVGLLGPNGAGKTTIMRILACFLPSTSGLVKISGLNVQVDSLAVRRKIGYFMEKTPVYPHMRVRDFLSFVAEIKGIPRRSRREVISEVVATCGLCEVMTRIIGNLSKGYRQRVGLAQALLNKPELLLLDEPTIGLDPGQVVEIRNFIKSLRGQTTVLLCTHVLPEVSQVCTKVIIIDKGRIVAEGTPEGLSVGLQGSKAMRVQIEASDNQIVEKFQKLRGIIRVEKGQSLAQNISYYLIEAGKDVDIPRELCALAFKNQWILREIQTVKMSLEDMFLRLVTKENQDHKNDERLFDF